VNSYSAQSAIPLMRCMY